MQYQTNPSDLVLLRKIVDDAPQLNRLVLRRPTSLPPIVTSTNRSVNIICIAFAEENQGFQ